MSPFRRSFSLLAASILALGPIVTAATMQEKTPAKAGQSEAEIRALLIGTWVGRKVVTYRPDGAWILRRNQGAPPTLGRWSLKGNRLTFVNPEAGTFTQTIASVSKKKLIFAGHDQDREWDRE